MTPREYKQTKTTLRSIASLGNGCNKLNSKVFLLTPDVAFQLLINLNMFPYNCSSKRLSENEECLNEQVWNVITYAYRCGQHMVCYSLISKHVNVSVSWKKTITQEFSLHIIKIGVEWMQIIADLINTSSTLSIFTYYVPIKVSSGNFIIVHSDIPIHDNNVVILIYS